MQNYLEEEYAEQTPFPVSACGMAFCSDMWLDVDVYVDVHSTHSYIASEGMK